MPSSYVKKKCPNEMCGNTYNFWGMNEEECNSPDLKCPYCYHFYNEEIGIPTTQKALGLRMLMFHYYNTAAPVMSILQLFKASDEAVVLNERAAGLLKRPGGLFARPCPPSPEHGFVESRIVHTKEELEQVRKETFAANPDSEVMLVEPVKAKWNAIWTPALLVLGKGHDGATSGKSTISIPLSGLNPLTPTLMEKALITEGKGPYIEAVCEDRTAMLCQLRGGPILESGISPDFIPQDISVEQIITTNGEDLLEWAKVIRAIKGQPGIVVHHPGGALTDHYSVHCRENGVTLITSFVPEVGQSIPASSQVVQPLDHHAMIDGIIAGDLANMGNHSGSYTALALLANHNSGVLRGPHSFWIGAGVAAILKLGSAALRAEARHAYSLPQGHKNKPECYDFYGKRPLSTHRAGVSRVSQILHYGFGAVNESHSFGGPKWSLCGAALCPLFDAVRDLVKNPTAEQASSLLMALNIAINQAHNGGWWLNKFIADEAYNRIPQGDPGYACYTGNAVMELDDLRGTVGVMREKWMTKVASWPDTIIQPLKWRKANLDVAPGSFILQLKPATVPTKQTIIIPTTPQLVKSLVEALGKVEISPGRVDLLTGSKRIALWTETPIVAQDRASVMKAKQ